MVRHYGNMLALIIRGLVTPFLFWQVQERRSSGFGTATFNNAACSTVASLAYSFEFADLKTNGKSCYGTKTLTYYFNPGTVPVIEKVTCFWVVLILAVFQPELVKPSGRRLWMWSLALFKYRFCIGIVYISASDSASSIWQLTRFNHGHCLLPVHTKPDRRPRLRASLLSAWTHLHSARFRNRRCIQLSCAHCNWQRAIKHQCSFLIVCTLIKLHGWALDESSHFVIPHCRTTCLFLKTRAMNASRCR